MYRRIRNDVHASMCLKQNQSEMHIKRKKRLKTLDVYLKKRGEKGIEVEAMG